MKKCPRCQKTMDETTLNEWIEKQAWKLNDALGDDWYYCEHFYHTGGYEGLPEYLKDMLREAIKILWCLK